MEDKEIEQLADEKPVNFKKLTVDKFEQKFEKKTVDKVLHHHLSERLPDNEVTLNSTFELNIYCNRCSNCNGVRCGQIIMPKSIYKKYKLPSPPQLKDK